MGKMDELRKIMEDGVGRVFTACASVVVQDGDVVFQDAVGLLDPEDPDSKAGIDSLFDLASITKLFTATLFLQLVDDEVIEIDAPVSSVLPEFSGFREIRPFENPLAPGKFISTGDEGAVDASAVTFRHLLTHSGGLPGWKPFYKLGSPSEIRRAVMSVDFAYVPGTKVVYSDPGFMILGWSIEKLTGMPLNEAVNRFLRAPYQLPSIGYGPVPRERAAATEFCPWRGRRMRGEVHDENAWALGGVSGHAGLFGNAVDLARFGMLWLETVSGDPVLMETDLAREATALQMEHGVMRRGLGWALWSPSETSPSHPFSRETFGHTGFTGTSIYIDPERRLVVVLLTNRVYFGRDAKGIRDFRLKFHSKIVELMG